jgi:hypothetical protein
LITAIAAMHNIIRAGGEEVIPTFDMPREPQLVIYRRGLSRLSMKSEERDELVGYVSDLGSLLDLEISLDGDSLNIGLDGTSIAVLRLQEGWAITCENYSEGVGIRIWGCEAEFYRDSSPT